MEKESIKRKRKFAFEFGLQLDYMTQFMLHCSDNLIFLFGWMVAWLVRWLVGWLAAWLG